jgi:hypothetical protein
MINQKIYKGQSSQMQILTLKIFIYNIRGKNADAASLGDTFITVHDVGCNKHIKLPRKD